MNRIKVRDTNVADVIHITPLLREADIKELNAVSPTNPPTTNQEKLQYSCDISYKCRTLLCDDEPFFIYGITKEGFVWAMGTYKVHEVKKEFMDVSWGEVDWLHDDFDVIGNFVHSENTLHISWLKKLGFEGFEPYEINENKFYKFWRNKKCVVQH